MPENDTLTKTHEAEMRMTAGMRLILAFSALAIIYIDPTDPDRHVALTYLTLTLYTAYSAVIYLLVLARVRVMYSFRFWTHWADIGWYLVLVALSSGTNSIFFMYFFFSIVVASFRWGFKLGMWTAVASSVLFAIVAYWTSHSDPNFELNRFLLRPIFLLVLGDMIAYRGGYEIILQRRIALLKEINTLSNPRFGIDRTIGSNMERLRAFYDATSCLCLITERATGFPTLRRVRRGDPEGACRAEPAPEDMSRRLLALPEDRAIIYAARASRLRPGTCYEYDVAKGERVAESRKAAEELALLLDTGSYLTVPLHYHGTTTGRLYLTAERAAFRHSDILFLLQIIDQIAPVLDNIKLVDRLALTAAEEERRKIARDIHDSVIQPYVGLQIGLSALEQKLGESSEGAGGEGGTDADRAASVTERVRRLREMAEEGISDLRRYVSSLKEGGEQEGNLLSALRRFAARFGEATGIAAQVEAEDGLRINDRLAAEVFQMVAEGLSNVRRHSQSARATIRLTRSTDRLILKIENDGAGTVDPGDFTPRSITERARSLQGNARVERTADGGSAVIVEIPL